MAYTLPVQAAHLQRVIDNDATQPGSYGRITRDCLVALHLISPREAQAIAERAPARSRSAATDPVQCARTWVHAKHETVEGPCPGLDTEQVRKAYFDADQTTVSGHVETPWGPAKVTAAVRATVDDMANDALDDAAPEDPWADWYVGPDAHGDPHIWDGSEEPAKTILAKKWAHPALWARATAGVRVLVEEPGAGAVVEASCPHSDIRVRWTPRRGRWHRLGSLDSTAGDAWDDLIDPVVLLTAEEA